MNIFQKINNSLSSIVRRKNLFSVFNELSLNWGKSKWNKSDFLNAYKISLYTNACVRKRAEKVGAVDFVVKKNKKEQPNHPLLKLLYKPNKFFLGRDFWGLYQTYKDLTGSAYILKLGSKGKYPEELHLLRPDLMSFKFDAENGEITKYLFKQANGKDKEYLPEEIIVSHYHDPTSQLSGLSLLAAAVNVIKGEEQISEYHAKVLKNGGRVEGIFNFKQDRLTKTQLSEMKDAYEEQYSDAKKSGKPLFLGGNAEYQNIGLKPSELSYLETKQVTLNDILLAFGVPKIILAQVEGVKYDNADASIRIFLRETIKPLLINLTTTLDEHFLPSDDLILDFVDPTPEDKEQKLKEIETAHNISALTINEKRVALGFDPLPGKEGDKILVPMNLVPLESEAKKGLKKKDFKHPLQDEKIRRKYWENYIKKADKREDKFIKVLNKYFKGQRERIVEKLEPANTRIFRRKNLIDDIFDKELEQKIARGEVLPMLQEFLIEAGVEAVEFVGSKFDFNITTDIAIWLDGKANIFAESINETTFGKLQREFAESLSEGESRDKLVNRIKETYGNIEKSRAATIARTEVQAVSQKGTFEGYKQAGMPIKIWVAVMDSKTRDWHANLDGEERPINNPFSNGLQFPGDPNGPADEVVNCRCTI